MKKKQLREELSEIVSLTKDYLIQEKEKGERYIHVKKGIAGSLKKDKHPLKEEQFDSLEKLNDALKNCKRCKLGKSRINMVFGTGDINAKLVFVGEGPGHDEDMQGVPFIGRAGKQLDKIINAMGLTREQVYIANVVKCHPMSDPSDPHKRGNDRAPLPEEIAQCKPFLLKQIEMINPKVVCSLGTHSSQTLLETKDTIGTLRGKFYEMNSFKLMPTYHPAALLRNPSLKRAVWEDMKEIMKELGLKRKTEI